MIKKAILIASSKKSEDPTAFKNDIYFLSSFLKSNEGGCWNDKEIIILENPSVEILFSTINRALENFRFIFFSGHGCVSNGSQYILIDNTLINIHKLINRVSREIVIFDCCRNEKKYDVLKNKYSLIESKIDNTDFIRKQYHEILKSNNGCFLAYTTAKGRPAFKYSKCSHFIYVFAKVLDQVKNSSIDKIVSIKKFLIMISLVMKKMVHFQTISYSYIENPISLRGK